mgnify:CR=1 FL=1
MYAGKMVSKQQFFSDFIFGNSDVYSKMSFSYKSKKYFQDSKLEGDILILRLQLVGDL